MANLDLSVIIPAKNNKAKTGSVIKMLSEKYTDINMEFIIIDINSKDGGVLDALNMLKERHLNGCVIQSGSGTVSSALNTGIVRANGKYVTFVYPTRLYKDYISDYIKIAEEKGAEFIFAVPEDDGDTHYIIPDEIKGTDIAVSLIRSSIVMDFTAVMFSREFLVTNHIRFDDDCTLGYAEAFIFNALMYNPVIAHVDIELERDYDNSLNKNTNSGVTNNCFERLDAMVKVSETVRSCHKNDAVLIDAFEYQKLPSVLMGCVDRLLEEGFGHTAIKKLVRNKSYDRYLNTSGSTSSELTKKIMVWKYLPWLYRP